MIDAAFTIYKSRFKQLITVSAVIVVPLGIIQALLLASILTNPEEAWPEAIRGLGAVAIAGLIVTQAATAALTLAVAGAYLNDDSTWQSVLGSAFGRIFTILGASILFALAMLVSIVGLIGGAVIVGAGLGGLGPALAMLVGIVGLIGGAVIVGAGLGVFMPALMVERIGATASLSRSWGLTSGNRIRVFGTWLVASIIASIVNAITGSVLGLAFSTEASAILANQLLAIVGAVLTTPFMAAVVVVIYFDLRVRKEGFDLQMLASQVNPAGGPGAGSDHFPPREEGGAAGGGAWPPPVDG